MPTLYQKFPGLSEVEKKVLIYPVSLKFTAPLVAGRFDWPSLVLPAFQGSSGERFILDGCNLAATIDQLTFSNAIDPSFLNGFFQLDIVRDGNGHRVTLAPFLFSAFNQGSEFSADFSPTATINNVENFSFRLAGALIQTPDLILQGITEISILLTANLYRVKIGMLK